MNNLDNSMYTTARIKKIGYIVICCLLKEIIISGKRIALYKELKSMRKLIDPLEVDMNDDMALLRILDEPHVKLASAFAEYVRFEILDPYSLTNLLDDYEVLEDEWASNTGFRFYRRFMFYRGYPLRRDRYINFGKVLRSAERLIYEMLKMMITGQTCAFNPGYKSNYSAGRLKALMVCNEDRNAVMMADLIGELKNCGDRVYALMVKSHLF